MVEPTHLKHLSQNGSFPQIGVNIKNHWNHHPEDFLLMSEKKHQPLLNFHWDGPKLAFIFTKALWWTGCAPESHHHYRGNGCNYHRGSGWGTQREHKHNIHMCFFQTGSSPPSGEMNIHKSLKCPPIYPWFWGPFKLRISIPLPSPNPTDLG